MVELVVLETALEMSSLDYLLAIVEILSHRHHLNHQSDARSHESEHALHGQKVWTERLPSIILPKWLRVG